MKTMKHLLRAKAEQRKINWPFERFRVKLLCLKSLKAQLLEQNFKQRRYPSLKRVQPTKKLIWQVTSQTGNKAKIDTGEWSQTT